MSDLLQSGHTGSPPKPPSKAQGPGIHHPDADQLNAFVEHALPERDRLETLAHLADCAHCRQVVALSVPPLEGVAQVARGQVVLPRFSASLTAWFSEWNVARNVVWIAVPVLAGLVILTFYLSHRPVGRTRLPGQIVESQSSAPPPVAVGSEPVDRTRSTASGASSAHKDRSEPFAKSVKAPNKADSFAGNNRRTIVPFQRTLPPSQSNLVPPKAAPAKAGETMGARVFESNANGIVSNANAPEVSPSKPTSTGAGLALSAAQTASVTTSADRITNPARQAQATSDTSSVARSVDALQAFPPNVLIQGHSAASALSTSIDSAPPTMNAQGKPSGAAEARAQSIEAPPRLLPGKVPERAPMASASARAAIFSPSASSSSDALRNIASRNSISTATMAPLPSGQAITSLAASLHRRLALDAYSQLFLTEDDGRHWRAVSAAWPGRAMTVSTIPAGFLKPLPAPLALSIPERYQRGAVASAQKDTDRAMSLGGIVSDQRGAAISAATIVVTDSRTNFVRSVQTDFAGRYLVEELSPGVYRIEGQAPGFQNQQQIAVVSSARQVIQNLMLYRGQSSQSVTISNSAAKLQISSQSRAFADAKAHMVAADPAANDLPPVFVLTTESGDVWTSSDGLLWKHK